MRHWVVIGLCIIVVIVAAIYVQRDPSDNESSTEGPAPGGAEPGAAHDAAPELQFRRRPDGSIAVVIEPDEGTKRGAGSVEAPEPETVELAPEDDSAPRLSAEERQRRRDAGNAQIAVTNAGSSLPAPEQTGAPVRASEPGTALPGIPEEDLVSGIDPAVTTGVLPGEDVEIEDLAGPLPGEGEPRVVGPLPGEGEAQVIGPLPGEDEPQEFGPVPGD